MLNFLSSKRPICVRLVMVIVMLMSPIAALAACDLPEYKQFDFWLGNWQVQSPDGQLVGYNRIEKVQDGCVLSENYHTPAGFSGQSLNIFEPNSQKWHQTWVDNSGTLLQLDGELVNSVMVMTGKTISKTGATLRHKISWSNNADNSVRQHWQTSKDDGQSWSTLFDGLYVRVEQ